jgi:hypothetical protein
MKVDAVHIEPFDFIQTVEFGLSRTDAFKLLVDVGNAKLQVLCLVWHNAEFRHISVSVLAGVVIAELGWRGEEENRSLTCVRASELAIVYWIIYIVQHKRPAAKPNQT